MEKRLTNIFFDSNYANYDKFVSNNNIILVHNVTLNVIIISAEEYIKELRLKNKRGTT